jgi:hypothetical protein
MKLMHHYATGLPGVSPQHSKRKSKSFIFFDVLLHWSGDPDQCAIGFIPFQSFLERHIETLISSTQVERFSKNDCDSRIQYDLDMG